MQITKTELAAELGTVPDTLFMDQVIRFLSAITYMYYRPHKVSDIIWNSDQICTITDYLHKIILWLKP